MLKYLVEKEFRQFFRNSFLPRLAVMYPILMVLIMPLAANFEVRDVKLAVVDADGSEYSRRLARKAVASGRFDLSLAATDYGAALRAVERGEADAILEIPRGFGRSLVADRSGSVMVSANAVSGAKGSLASSYLQAIVADFSSEVRGELLPQPAGPRAPSFSVVPRYRFNPRLEYPAFMVPALMTMLLAMLCGFLPALNIVLEREKGTMEQMNVTPVRRLTLIMSKLIPYWAVGFVSLSLGFLIARVAYSLSPAGSLVAIYLLSSVFVVAISGLGLVISNYAQTLQQAMFMMFFFLITMILMSGLYTPAESMPDWAQAISAFSPLKYIIEIMRMCYLKGSSLADMWRQIAALAGFAVFFNAWAVVSYRKTS